MFARYSKLHAPYTDQKIVKYRFMYRVHAVGNVTLKIKFSVKFHLRPCASTLMSKLQCELFCSAASSATKNSCRGAANSS